MTEADRQEIRYALILAKDIADYDCDITFFNKALAILDADSQAQVRAEQVVETAIASVMEDIES